MCDKPESDSGAMTTRVGWSSGDEWFPRHDINDHRESPDSAEPRLRNDPELRSEAADPMLPIDRIDPTLPIESIE